MSNLPQPSEEVFRRIREKIPRLTEQQQLDLYCHVRAELAKMFEKHFAFDKDYIPPVIEFIIGGEINHNLDRHAEEFLDKLKREDEIKETIAVTSVFPFKSRALEPQDINRPVKAGGLTLLHVKVEENDLDGIKHLCEVCRAKVSVRDNSGQTPLDLARSLGYVEIVSYLENAFTGEGRSELK